MNKQEAIEEINNLKGLTVLDKTINFDSEMVSKKEVLNIAKQLDEPVKPPEPKPLEPKKPVVPQYVADMIIEKKKKYGIVDVIKNLGVFNNPFDLIVEKQLNWIVENQEDFAKAWLYGYEVEKEKRYTAKLKLTDEYLGYESRFEDFLHYKVPDNSAKKEKTYHFTKDDLVKYHIWGNDNYEVKEVEE